MENLYGWVKQIWVKLCELCLNYGKFEGQKLK